MKYFAEIKNNIVQRTIIIESGEHAKELFGGEWIETFRSSPNKNYAKKGHIYLPQFDNFHSPKPHEDWQLNDKLKWRPLPTDENVNIIPSHIKPKTIISENNDIYKWNNKIIKWEKI